MAYEVREVGVDDLAAAWELGRLAFGGSRTPPEGWETPRPARTTWGAFDSAGRLVAKAVDRHQGHWFGGQVIPAAGIAGVAVAPDQRGRGVLRPVMARLLAAARGRGAMISTLFDTTPVPYRRFGWEEVGALTWRTLPTLALAGIRAPETIGLRPATAEDIPAVFALYAQVARAGRGHLDRSPPIMDTSAPAVFESFDGVTLAEAADGTLLGYCAWTRENGYDEAGRLRVHDLIAVTPDGTNALLAMLASWASVAPTLELKLPEPDPVFLLASSAMSRQSTRDPWMLRLVDAPAAVAARGWPSLVDTSLDLLLDDDMCPDNSGRYRLELTGGRGQLSPGGTGALRLSMRGLAMVYAGVGAPALLRRTGHLDGGDVGSDEIMHAIMAGPPPTLLDYF